MAMMPIGYNTTGGTPRIFNQSLMGQPQPQQPMDLYEYFRQNPSRWPGIMPFNMTPMGQQQPVQGSPAQGRVTPMPQPAPVKRPIGEGDRMRMPTVDLDPNIRPIGKDIGKGDRMKRPSVDLDPNIGSASSRENPGYSIQPPGQRSGLDGLSAMQQYNPYQQMAQRLPWMMPQQQRYM